MDLKRKLEIGAHAYDTRGKFDPKTRASFMNASEAENCPRRQWYSKKQPDLAAPQSWGYARRGHFVEEYVCQMLTLANVDHRLTGADQQSLQCGLISGTPDGVIVDDNVLIGLEIKSFDPRKNRKAFPADAHVTQLQLNMCLIDELAGMLGLPDMKMSHGVIVYVNASDFDEVIIKRVPYNPTLIDDMQPKAKKILNARSASSFAREGKMRGGKECNLCAFKAVCLTGDDIETGTLTRAAPKGTRLDASVNAYVEQQGIKKDAELAMAEEAERIKAELKKRGVDKVTVGDHNVTLSQVAGRKSFDKKAAEAAGLDLSGFEKVGAPSERLKID